MLKQIILWLWKFKFFYITIFILGIGCFLLCFLGFNEFPLRSVGLIFQLFWFIMTIFQLNNSKKQFPGFSFWGEIKEVFLSAPFLFKTCHIKSSGNKMLSLEMSGRVSVHPSADGSIEDRVKLLEDKYLYITRLMEEKYISVNEKIKDVETNISCKNMQNFEKIKKIESCIKKLSTSSLHISIVSIFFFIAGSILCTLSREIAQWVKYF